MATRAGRQRLRGAVEQERVPVAPGGQSLHLLDLGEPAAQGGLLVLPRPRHRPLAAERLRADVLVGQTAARRREAEVQGRLSHYY